MTQTSLNNNKSRPAHIIRKPFKKSYIVQANNEVKLTGAGKLLTKGYLIQGLMDCLQFCQIHPFLCSEAFLIFRIILSGDHPGRLSLWSRVSEPSLGVFLYNDAHYDRDMAT